MGFRTARRRLGSASGAVTNIRRTTYTPLRASADSGLASLRRGCVGRSQGLYGRQLELPGQAGFEGCGTVVRSGEDAGLLPVGTRVAFRSFGSWAEYCMAPVSVPEVIAPQLRLRRPFCPQASDRVRSRSASTAHRSEAVASRLHPGCPLTKRFLGTLFLDPKAIGTTGGGEGGAGRWDGKPKPVP